MVAFERRCIHTRCVPLPATYSPSTPQSRALPARRIDALGALPYLWDCPQVRDRIYEPRY